MSFARLTSVRRSHWTFLLGLLCIALLLVAVTAQAVHTHPDGSIHGDCTLCVSAHAVPAIAALPISIPFLEAIDQFVPQRTEIFERQEIPFALSIRPPPNPSEI